MITLFGTLCDHTTTFCRSRCCKFSHNGGCSNRACIQIRQTVTKVRQLRADRSTVQHVDIRGSIHGFINLFFLFFNGSSNLLYPQIMRSQNAQIHQLRHLQRHHLLPDDLRTDRHQAHAILQSRYQEHANGISIITGLYSQRQRILMRSHSRQKTGGILRQMHAHENILSSQSLHHTTCYRLIRQAYNKNFIFNTRNNHNTKSLSLKSIAFFPPFKILAAAGAATVCAFYQSSVNAAPTNSALYLRIVRAAVPGDGVRTQAS